MDLSAQLRLLEVRRELERLMARGAAEARHAGRTQGVCRDRARHAGWAAEKQDGLAFMRLDQQFNMLILTAASRNEFATALDGPDARVCHGASGISTTRRPLICLLAARLHAEVAEARRRARTSRPPAPPPMRLMAYIESFARSTLVKKLHPPLSRTSTTLRIASPALSSAKPSIDLVEADVAGDQFVELQPPSR